MTPSPTATRAGVKATRLRADQWACLMARIINDLRVSDHISHEELAAALNERGIPTLRDGTWHRTTVQNLLRRYAHVRRTNPDLVSLTLVSPPAALLEFIARKQTEHLERQPTPARSRCGAAASPAQKRE